ncbi:hypothetical protein, partial [Eisenbergiella porci]|uniref:hypothetical protein n=1 Tax=Eisenbergiella porci TaxID=2652274 RepID=UPI002A91D284
MAFKKKTWTDRMVEYAGRRKLTNTSTKQAVIYDVERAEGTVSKEGDAFSSQNMNDLEQRVADGFTGVEQGLAKVNQDLGALNSKGNAELLVNGTTTGIKTVPNLSQYRFLACYMVGNIGYMADLIIPVSLFKTL